jgi:DNA-damage-inducible protein J
MATKTAVLSARIDPDLKSEAERVFKHLGLNTTQAITLFFKQVELQQGLPFEVRIPNSVTRQALTEAKERRNLKTFEDVDALFADLGIQ